MVMKVTVVQDERKYVFNILSEIDGIALWLTNYEILDPAHKGRKRWSFMGNPGTFIDRQSIVIPASVIKEAQKKITESFYLKGH